MWRCHIEVGPTPALRNLGEVGANFLEEMGQWMVSIMYNSELKKVQIDLISKGNWTMDESQDVLQWVNFFVGQWMNPRK
jgi:hypothetical protein